MEFVVPDLRDGYVTVVRGVLEYGNEVSPRGYKTWEIEDATVVVEDCRRLLPVGVGRDPRPAIGAAEAIGLCAGVDATDLCVSVSGTFRRFLDGSNLWGQYGKRVRGQMETLIRRLRGDENTRQAVVEIWDPAYDQVDARDLPCTLGFGFRVRGGELHMSARMRSQDAWLGLAYDAFFFGQLGWTVANALGLELGRICIKQDSLHVYERDVEKIEQLRGFEPVLSPLWSDGEYCEPTGFGEPWHDGLQYESFRRRAESVYNREPLQYPHATESELWYFDILDGYDRLTRVENFSS